MESRIKQNSVRSRNISTKNRGLISKLKNYAVLVGALAVVGGAIGFNHYLHEAPKGISQSKVDYTLVCTVNCYVDPDLNRFNLGNMLVVDHSKGDKFYREYYDPFSKELTMVGYGTNDTRYFVLKDGDKYFEQTVVRGSLGFRETDTEKIKSGFPSQITVNNFFTYSK